jgi:hypothetical protein
VAVLGGEIGGGFALVGFALGIGAGRQQAIYHLGIAVRGGGMQRREARGFDRIGRSAAAEEQFEKLQLATGDCRVERGNAHRVAGGPVDLGPGLGKHAGGFRAAEEDRQTEPGETVAGVRVEQAGIGAGEGGGAAGQPQGAGLEEVSRQAAGWPARRVRCRRPTEREWLHRRRAPGEVGNLCQQGLHLTGIALANGIEEAGGQLIHIRIMMMQTGKGQALRDQFGVGRNQGLEFEAHGIEDAHQRGNVHGVKIPLEQE